MTALWGHCGHQTSDKWSNLTQNPVTVLTPAPHSTLMSHICKVRQGKVQSVHINVTVIRRHQQLLEGGLGRIRRWEREWQPEGMRRVWWKGNQAGEMARKEEGSGGKQRVRVMWSAARNGHGTPWATLALHKMCCITLMGNEGEEWQRKCR